MNSSEEELQNQFESGQMPGADGLDVKAYREVFRVLKKDPGYDLSVGFAERVVARMIGQQQTRYSRDYFWFGAGMSLLILALIATVWFTGFRFDFGFLRVMADYKELAIFGIIFIVFLNWLDKRFVRDKHQASL